MKIVVIGATGHVGSYLVPRLVQLGHEVIAVSRGRRAPYRPHAAWDSVQRVILDREVLEAEGAFGSRVAALQAQVVVDMVCFTEASARHLVESLRGKVQHFLSCGTIWVHGHSVSVPTTEDQPRHPFGEYGIQKAAIEAYLLEEARRGGFPATVLHPGHIVGQGWTPLNPAGNFNPAVYERIARGEELALPNLGLETVHHVHADDVAQGFVRALQRWSASVGESFHLVAPAAFSLRGYAESVFAWFGKEPRLAYLPWEQWRRDQSEEDAFFTWDHIAHSPSCSIAKAQTLLGYQPRYTSLQAVFESLEWLIGHGALRFEEDSDGLRLDHGNHESRKEPPP
ncbi:MAG: NAD-dependent epimerase/dehydratase family protein [Spirochaetales bacterium]|nr:NAD-dependent epimerase/dehydratase family protein [Spirochaetales bacterium]